jgi:putative NIF3 family GTP cyclohydrolase 1 type 2
MKAREIFPIIESIAPLERKDDWDNPGFQMGNMDREVKKIGVTHDWAFLHGETYRQVQIAIEQGCDFLLGHHPLFQPIRSGPIRSLGGSLVSPREDLRSKNLLEIARLVANAGVCVYCSHTPWDKSPGGTRDSYATKLGVTTILEGEPKKYRIGPVNPITFADFKKKVEKDLMTKVMNAQGPEDKVIRKMAAIGGGGLSDYAMLAELLPPTRSDIDCICGSEANKQAQQYMRIHHPGVCYLGVHHSASERWGMINMIEILKKLLPPDITLTYIWEPEPVYIAPK